MFVFSGNFNSKLDYWSQCTVAVMSRMNDLYASYEYFSSNYLARQSKPAFIARFIEPLAF